MYTQSSKISSVITTTYDIDIYIKAVSTFIDRHVGYKLAVQPTGVTKDLFFDGSGTDTLVLNKYVRKASNLSVWENGVERTDVYKYPLNEDYFDLLQFDRNLRAGNANIEVKNCLLGRYLENWGQNDHSIPEDITLACTELVIAMIKKQMAIDSENGTGSIKSETIGAYSVTYQDVTTLLGSSNIALLSANSILDNYKYYFIM